jgi:hypothetical protein
MADDLFGFVAFDPFGAHVPGGNPPARIQHEDRAVGDAIHQLRQLPLAALQRFGAQLHLPFQVLVEFPQLLGHAGTLGRLPAAARHQLHHLRFVLSPVPSLRLMNRQGTDQTPRLQQRDTDERTNVHLAIGIQHVASSRIDLDIVDDKRLARPQRAQTFGTEVGDSIAPDDARCVVVIVPRDDNRVLVCLDVGIGAAIHPQVLAQMDCDGMGDLRRIDQGAHRVVEGQQEIVRCSLRRHFSH